ncbi:MAG: hypothetical protein KGL39_37110 [Patescibacteria group bacterium]|nr:hypothetical protein [Patescibacteria group bacterium]
MGIPKLIYCMGGNPEFRQIAEECGWLNGARLPDTVYGGPLYFADQNYHNPDRGSYMKALSVHRPEMATVLDWQDLEDWKEVYDWAEEASQFVKTIVIIPKVSGVLGQIPRKINDADVVLGYSVPTSYGASPIPLWEFREWPVHLLGGSPQKQLDIANYLNVVSADGSMAQQQAFRCRFWSKKSGPKGHWVQLSESGDKRISGAHAEAFRKSLMEIKKAWLERIDLAESRR